MSKTYFNSYTQAPETHFTQISNALIRTPTLSCKAFKLLCIGLSHSSWWEFNKKQIATCFKEGDHTLDVAMKELRDLGYLHLVARRRYDGRMVGHNWFWFYEPLSEENFKKFHRNLENPELGGNRGSEDMGDIRRPEEKKTIPSKEHPLTSPTPPSAAAPRKLDASPQSGESLVVEEEGDKPHEMVPSWIAQRMGLPKAQRIVAEALKAGVEIEHVRQAFEDGIANDTIDNPYAWLLSFAQKRATLRDPTQGTGQARNAVSVEINGILGDLLRMWYDCVSRNGYKDTRLDEIQRNINMDRAARRVRIPEEGKIVIIELNTFDEIQEAWYRVERAVRHLDSMPSQ